MANKTKVIQIRLTEEEYAIIKNAYKTNLSSLIRDMLLKNTTDYTNPEEEEDIRDLYKFKEYLHREEVVRELFNDFKNKM